MDCWIYRGNVFSGCDNCRNGNDISKCKEHCYKQFYCKRCKSSIKCRVKDMDYEMKKHIKGEIHIRKSLNIPRIYKHPNYYSLRWYDKTDDMKKQEEKTSKSLDDLIKFVNENLGNDWEKVGDDC